MKGNPLNLLLIEDDPAHAEMTIRALENLRVANPIHHVTDGQQALDYLRRQGTYADAQSSPRPNLILLDLRLPKVDGLEVLRQIKENPDLANIPVVILTTSAAESDIAHSYEFRANSYLVKPIDFPKFNQMMESLGYYWLGWNEYPHE